MSCRHPSSTIGQAGVIPLHRTALGLHRLPQAMRLSIVTKHNGPPRGWPMKTVRRQDSDAARTPRRRRGSHGNRRILTLSGDAGTTVHATDHVIAATGTGMDLRRLAFLSEDLVSSIRAVNDRTRPHPRTSSHRSPASTSRARFREQLRPMMRSPAAMTGRQNE